MPWTYILRCADGCTYVGSTHHKDLGRRLDQHASGKGAAFTASRRPLELVWCEEFSSVQEAWLLERQIHGWGRKKREALIRGDFHLLPGLSKSKTPKDSRAPD